MTKLLISRYCLPLFLCASLVQVALNAKPKTAFTFENPTTADNWFSVNDGVMGGISTGGFRLTDEGTLLFSGNLSLENNGGFASIRSRGRDIDLKGASSIIVNARGDGRTYWVGLRGAKQGGASSFRAFFPTVAGELTRVRIPLSEFKFQTFGRQIPLRTLDPGAVQSIGFTIADKQPGSFRLEIESIEIGYDEDSSKPSPASATIVDIAARAGTFDILVAAAKAAGLVGALNGKGPLTIFAPTDDAFAALPEGTVSSLLKPANKEQLASILKYHVIAGNVTLADALKAKQATTLQGDTITIAFDTGSVKVGKAKLLNADIQASNGLIHVIDQVLLPPAVAHQPLSPSALITLAIERGVPLYNNGNPAACAAVYEIAIEALRTMPNLPDALREELANTMNQVRASGSAVDRAWILRRALDRADDQI